MNTRCDIFFVSKHFQMFLKSNNVNPFFGNIEMTKTEKKSVRHFQNQNSFKIIDFFLKKTTIYFLKNLVHTYLHAHTYTKTKADTRASAGTHVSLYYFYPMAYKECS